MVMTRAEWLRRIEAAEAATEGVDPDGDKWIEVTVINDPEEASRNYLPVPPELVPKGPEGFAAYKAWCEAHPQPETRRTIRIKCQPRESDDDWPPRRRRWRSAGMT
jgi:hypothetical protein